MTDQQMFITAIVAEFTVIGTLGTYIAALHKKNARENREMFMQLMKSHGESTSALENNNEAMKTITEVLTIVKYRLK